MPYYPDLNLIFIHIPKTAGGSIEYLLLPHKAPGRKTLLRRVLATLAIRQDPMAAYIRGHSTAAWHRRVLGPHTFDNACRFAVVRNPYDRLISMYEYIRQTPTHHWHGRALEQDFTTFLRSRRLSQMPFIVGSDGQMLVDRLIAFERLHDELPAFFAELGITQSLPTSGRRNSSEKKPPSHYLTAENIDIINQDCAEDFRRLGYVMRSSRS